MAENLTLLLLTAFPLMGSPGPATLSLAALGSAFGVAPSLRYLAGIVLGTTTVLGIVASGVSGVVMALPGAVPAVTALAAAYIVYLAWKIATAPPVVRGGAEKRAPQFAGGYLLAIANPKAFAAIGAAYSSVVVVEQDIGADAAAKIAALFVVIITVNTVWLMFGSAFAALLSTPRLARVINVSFALLLIASVAAAILI